MEGNIEDDFYDVDTYEKNVMCFVIDNISKEDKEVSDLQNCIEYLIEEPSRSKEFFYVDNTKFAIKILGCIMCKKCFAFPNTIMYRCIEENHEHCGYCKKCFLSNEKGCKTFYIDKISNLYEKFCKIPEIWPNKLDLDDPEDRTLYEFLN